jgi:hypothetical protein
MCLPPGFLWGREMQDPMFDRGLDMGIGGCGYSIEWEVLVGCKL